MIKPPTKKQTRIINIETPERDHYPRYDPTRPIRLGQTIFEAILTVAAGLLITWIVIIMQDCGGRP
jgi:hypothetical protein